MVEDDAPQRKRGPFGAGDGADESAVNGDTADRSQSTRGPGAREDSGAGGVDRPPPSESDQAASEVDALKTEVASLRDRLLRERAELENYKKRATREKAEALRFANEGLLRDLLPVIDNLQRALEHARASHHAAPIVEGVELVLRGLDETLAKHGVRVVAARGTPFDPRHHEAIGQVESDAPAHTVVDEHQRGYLLHDRLLRPALVTVSKPRHAGRLGAPGAGGDGDGSGAVPDDDPIAEAPDDD